MSGVHPFTTARRLTSGAELRAGAIGAYRSVAVGPGEPHLVRDELVGGGTGRPAAGRTLAVLGHITDLQLADVQSPTRFEYLNRGFGDPRYKKIIPVQRPQETLTAHAIETTLRTLNNISGAPVSGAGLDLVVTTGDAIDNAQWNEVQAFLALFDGGLVRLASGGSEYEGVQSLSWPDDIFWRPDGDGPDGPDYFSANFGFPRHPGLISRALREFETRGLSVPWLACFGNHEGLNQGVGAVTPALAEALIGDRKPVGLPEDFDHDNAYETFIDHPEEFFKGQTRQITADPSRRPVTRAEFVEAHFRDGARPEGHGFRAANRASGHAYYVHDTKAVRLISLDTTCLAGGADGCVDHDQSSWLTEQLIEVHSRFFAPTGDEIATGNDDRLVVIFSHHSLETLDNERCGPGGPAATPHLGSTQLLALLHRFPNVVLWLNGHTHTNRVRVRPSPRRPGAGLWEVTTCAVVDWPCQTRIVEVIECPDGSLSIVCTMLDHDAPLAPGQARSRAEIASLHRELAANVPWAGFGSRLAGDVQDRNVELRVNAPFPLERLDAR